MSCTTKKVLHIIRGEDRVARITLRDEETGDPIDLSTVGEIIGCFPLEDGTWLQKKLSLAEVTIVDPDLGKITITLPDTDTALMKVGENLSFEVEIEDGTENRIVQFEEQLTVKSRLCA